MTRIVLWLWGGRVIDIATRVLSGDGGYPLCRLGDLLRVHGDGLRSHLSFCNHCTTVYSVCGRDIGITFRYDRLQGIIE